MAATDAHNGIEPEEIEGARVALNRARHVEFILVIVAAFFSMLATGFSGWAAYQVLSCTTPGGPCYQRYTVSAREASRQNQLELRRQHEIIQCVLLIDPDERDIASLETCEAQHPRPKE